MEGVFVIFLEIQGYLNNKKQLSSPFHFISPLFSPSFCFVQLTFLSFIKRSYPKHPTNSSLFHAIVLSFPGCPPLAPFSSIFSQHPLSFPGQQPSLTRLINFIAVAGPSPNPRSPSRSRTECCLRRPCLSVVSREKLHLSLVLFYFLFFFFALSFQP